MIFLVLLLLAFSLLVPLVRQFLFVHLPNLPSLSKWLVIDIYRYFKYREWEIFNGFGLHIWVGLFGKGKTISMVEYAYRLAKQYPRLNIYTNINLYGFPNPERIKPLVSYMDIVNAPGDSIFILDEISTLFQSRSWANFPMPLLSQLLQVRKNKKMILATAQRFSHVDKLIRDVTYSVIDCNCYFKRYNTCNWYLAEDWENKNVMNIPVPYGFSAFVQTDKIRSLYDTEQIIGNTQKDDFLSQEEILNRQAGGSTVIAITAEKKPKKKLGFGRA